MFKRVCVGLFCVLLSAACVPAPHSQLVIDEHLLSAAPDISTDQLVFHFAQGDQQALLSHTKHYKDYDRQVNAYNQRALEPFGYQLKTHPGPDGGAGHDYIDVYRGDQLIARDVITMGPVSLNASQTDFIAMPLLSDGPYLFTRDAFHRDTWGPGRHTYRYVGDQLLSVDLSDTAPGISRLTAYLDDKPAYEAQFNNVSTYASFEGPWTYGKHWALVLLDAKGSTGQGWEPFERLIQDGQDINTLKGYERSFEFALLDGLPFYFYQKDGKLGISFNGQEIAKDYYEIPHYACCSEAILNPGRSMNMVWFFARRGSDWYYVEAYLPTAP